MRDQKQPMGFNTWNTFGTDIDEKTVRELACALTDKGLAKAGYTYLCLDDGWSEKQRDPQTGRLLPDRDKFPSGMKALVDYVHGKGLKFGIYSCAGALTCQTLPGSFDQEFLDARTFAEWGCDYLKYDYCYRPAVDSKILYRRMGMALRATGKEILYSICTGGCEHPERWARSAGGDLFRTTADIEDNYESFKQIAESQLHNLCCSAPGGYNDLDMLTVGMHGKGNVGAGGCTDREYKTEFVLWCLYGAPLMLGCDIRTLEGELLELVKNKNLIALCRDPECRPSFEVSAHPWIAGRKVYMRFLSDGSYAVAFFNFSETAGNIPFYLFNAGLTSSSGYGMILENMLTGERSEIQTSVFEVDLKPHDCAIFRARLVKI